MKNSSSNFWDSFNSKFDNLSEVLQKFKYYFSRIAHKLFELHQKRVSWIQRKCKFKDFTECLKFFCELSVLKPEIEKNELSCWQLIKNAVNLIRGNRIRKLETQKHSLSSKLRISVPVVSEIRDLSHNGSRWVYVSSNLRQWEQLHFKIDSSFRQVVVSVSEKTEESSLQLFFVVLWYTKW